MEFDDTCPTVAGEVQHIAGCTWGQPIRRRWPPRVQYAPTPSIEERHASALERIAAALERIADQGDSLVRPQAPQSCCTPETP